MDFLNKHVKEGIFTNIRHYVRCPRFRHCPRLGTSPVFIHCTQPNINWRYVQRQNVVNNVDMSSLRPPWQNKNTQNDTKTHRSPWRNSHLEEKHTIFVFFGFKKSVVHLRYIYIVAHLTRVNVRERRKEEHVL